MSAATTFSCVELRSGGTRYVSVVPPCGVLGTAVMMYPFGQPRCCCQAHWMMG